MKNKKGFTLVELVIVIAVIAILAGVMIGTFASVIRKAHMSNDVQLVRNLNTALRADIKEHKTMQEALDAAADFDYDVSIITASASGNEILWDSVNDYFCYFDKDNDSISYYPEIEFKDGKAPEDYQLWKIYSGKEKVPATQTYSVYWNKTGTDGLPITLNVGFDAGENTKITKLTYERRRDTEEQTEQKVTFRTNEGTKLTINAATDTVYHYGKAACADVQAVAEKSYHVYGEVELVKISQGRVKVEAGGKVETVLATTNNATVDKEKAGVIENAYKASGVTSTNGNVTLKYEELHVTSSNCNYTLAEESSGTTITLSDPMENGNVFPCVFVSDTDITLKLDPVGNNGIFKYTIIAKCGNGVIIYNGLNLLYYISYANSGAELGSMKITGQSNHEYRTQLVDGKITITGATQVTYTLDKLKALCTTDSPTELVLGVAVWGQSQGGGKNQPISYFVGEKAAS